MRYHRGVGRTSGLRAPLVVMSLASVALLGCTTEITQGGTEGLTPAQAKAQTYWLKKALPVFKASCAMCHDGSMANIGYLAGMSDLDVRDTLIAFMPPLVNFGAPQSSRVLSKGAHTGPALTAVQASDILSWITAQRDAEPPLTVIESAQLTPMLCTAPPCPVNTIDLAAFGGGAGSTLNFSAMAVGPDIYLTALGVKAGSEGLYLAHPLFDSWPAGATMPTPDPTDRFFNVRLNLMPGAMAPLGDGTGGFAGFTPTNPISVRVDAIDKYRPGG